MWAILAGAVVLVVLLIRWRRSGRSLGMLVVLGVPYLYARLWHRLTCNGLASLPRRGPAILIANHTCSADAAFLTAGYPRPLSFLMADEYSRIPVLRQVFHYLACVPVSRNGRDAVAVRVALRRLADNRVVCIFPEGGLSNAGRTRLRRGKAGAALLALRSRAPVIPALIRGGPQTSQVLRAWVTPSRVRLVFGPPVDLSAYYGRPIDRRLLEEVTRVLMERIEALGHPSGSCNEGDCHVIPHCDGTGRQALHPV
jgi:1-acyl-sn-glycerol-3-phosphate acyltransferase